MLLSIDSTYSFCPAVFGRIDFPRELRMLCDSRSGSVLLRSAGVTSLPEVTAVIICVKRCSARATDVFGPDISTSLPRAVNRTSGKLSSIVLRSLSSGPNTKIGSTPEISITIVFESFDSKGVKSHP